MLDFNQTRPAPNPHAWADAWSYAEFWKRELRDPCFVYVAGCEKAIKVGKANDVYARFDTLQCGNPVRLSLLHVVPGDHELEARLHRWLRDDRIHGEWFEGATVPVVLERVAELADELVKAYEGDGIAPPWKGLVSWPAAVTYHSRRPRRAAEVTTRYVDPATIR